MKRWIYWGIPIIGCLIGCIITVRMLKRGESLEALSNQVDAFGGAVIWFGIVTAIRISLILLRG